MADVIIESRYDFRDVTVPEKLLEIKVSGETVSAEMDRAALRFATIEPTDSPIRQGDFVRVELPGQEGPETVQINVGNGFADEALEDILPGMCQGDERVLSLNGSEAAVRLLSVKRRMIPRFTDDLVQKLGLEGAGTVQDYREYIVRQIAEQCNQLHPSLIGVNMLTIYPDSELYQEIQRGTWKEEGEIEKYKEIRSLLENLEIPTQFAALGASNAFQFHGTLPEDKHVLVAALDKIIRTVREDDLREYRVNLRHL